MLRLELGNLYTLLDSISVETLRKSLEEEASITQRGKGIVRGLC